MSDQSVRFPVRSGSVAAGHFVKECVLGRPVWLAVAIWALLLCPSVAAGDLWIDLFDGQTVKGWTPRGEVELRVVDGELHLNARKNVWVVTDYEAADFVLEAEVKIPRDPAPGPGLGVNSGIGFRCSGEKGRPMGYQCEIDGSARNWTGGLHLNGDGWVNPVKSDPQSVTKLHKLAQASFRRDDWNRFRIECRGQHIRIWVNDVLTTDVHDARFQKGFFGIQHHGRGGVYRFRNIRVRPIHADDRGKREGPRGVCAAQRRGDFSSFVRDRIVPGVVLGTPPTEPSCGLLPAVRRPSVRFVDRSLLPCEGLRHSGDSWVDARSRRSRFPSAPYVALGYPLVFSSVWTRRRRTQHTARIPIGGLLWLLVWSFPSAGVRAEPQPGEAYREYTWARKGQGGFVPLLVFSPEGKRPDAKLRAPRTGTMHVDLADAAKAEVVVEHWSGHVGTSKKAIRFNGHDWIPLPLPAGTPDSAECYMAALTKTAVPVPLSHLRDGTNTFAVTCGPQICHNFHYPAFAVYGITLRVFLKTRAARPTGEIISPHPGDSLDDNPVIVVRATSPTGRMKRVDVIAEYEDFDWEGNGRYREWHYDLAFSRIRHHVGKAERCPAGETSDSHNPYGAIYRVTWNTRWVPDQSIPMRLQARVTDEAGVTYVTAPVAGLTFNRNRSVRLYKASDVPAWFSSRVGMPKYCSITLPTDVAQTATAAQLVVATHGPHDEPGEFGLNGQGLARVAPSLPGRAMKQFHRTTVPIDLLRKGFNRFHVLSRTNGHALEVLWPGPVLLVEVDGQPP